MIICSKLGNGEARKYVFRAANVWWRCAQYFAPPVARCIETIDVCIWHMFVFMSVVTVCGSVGMFVV